MHRRSNLIRGRAPVAALPILRPSDRKRSNLRRCIALALVATVALPLLVHAQSAPCVPGGSCEAIGEGVVRDVPAGTYYGQDGSGALFVSGGRLVSSGALNLVAAATAGSYGILLEGGFLEASGDVSIDATAGSGGGVYNSGHSQFDGRLTIQTAGSSVTGAGITTGNGASLALNGITAISTSGDRAPGIFLGDTGSLMATQNVAISTTGRGADGVQLKSINGAAGTVSLADAT